MTRPDLDAIEARANAATPGPWRVDPNDNSDPYLTVQSDHRCIYELGEMNPVNQADRADAEFIAHARIDIPALLDYVRNLEARLK